MSAALRPRAAVLPYLRLLAIAMPGCGVWRPVSVPMAALPEPARCATPVDTLPRMLPGSFARPEACVREGFVRALRERQLVVDMIPGDALLGFFSKRPVHPRTPVPGR